MVCVCDYYFQSIGILLMLSAILHRPVKAFVLDSQLYTVPIDFENMVHLVTANPHVVPRGSKQPTT